ncbi:hypothetical protein FWK35_00018720 [Aphis craccivora]|uniref:Uncharacterized protein n=1 Tax=Aphis craccivora TaxID=307492 RepID=A0A6G0YJD9_APHCR|nr:hypothetical protein FWK35_00018720 [Aphis craccivora]
MVELHLGSKKVFSQKYYAFDVVKRLRKHSFPFPLWYRLRTDNDFNHWRG